MTSSRLVSRRIALMVGVGVSALPLFAGFPAFSQQSPPDLPRAKEIQAIIDKAAQLIDSQGKTAFPKLGEPDSEWRRGDTYVFVGDMKG